MNYLKLIKFYGHIKTTAEVLLMFNSKQEEKKKLLDQNVAAFSKFSVFLISSCMQF
jgi:hypothetical protein